jgi:hypothetical protein
MRGHLPNKEMGKSYHWPSKFTQRIHKGEYGISGELWTVDCEESISTRGVPTRLVKADKSDCEFYLDNIGKAL